jgi:hypothetical protein
MTRDDSRVARCYVKLVLRAFGVKNVLIDTSISHQCRLWPTTAPYCYKGFELTGGQSTRRCGTNDHAAIGKEALKYVS